MCGRESKWRNHRAGENTTLRRSEARLKSDLAFTEERAASLQEELERLRCGLSRILVKHRLFPHKTAVIEATVSSPEQLFGFFCESDRDA